jgi:hypothetical protein
VRPALDCVGHYAALSPLSQRPSTRSQRAAVGDALHKGLANSVDTPLNYLAFSHFIRWPEDSLRQFGHKTFGEVFHSEDEGEAFAELLAAWDGQSLSQDHKKDLARRDHWPAKWPPVRT